MRSPPPTDRPGSVATLVLPADSSWSESTTGPCPPRPRAASPVVAAETLEGVAKALRSGERVGAPARGVGPARPWPSMPPAGSAAPAARRCSARPSRPIWSGEPGFPPSTGSATWPSSRRPSWPACSTSSWSMPSPPSPSSPTPARPSDLVPPGCTVHTLVPSRRGRARRARGTGRRCSVRRPTAPHRLLAARPERPTGSLTTETLAAAIGADAARARHRGGRGQHLGTVRRRGHRGRAPPRLAHAHRWGHRHRASPRPPAPPWPHPSDRCCASRPTGAPCTRCRPCGRRPARGFNVTTVVLANRSYAILNMELHRVGADGGGPRCPPPVGPHRPRLDFVALARGMGVPARRVETAEELTSALAESFAEPGPSLIEIPLPGTAAVSGLRLRRRPGRPRRGRGPRASGPCGRRGPRRRPWPVRPGRR